MLRRSAPPWPRNCGPVVPVEPGPPRGAQVQRRHVTPRVIVTRPEREAQRWANELGRLGLDAQPLPLMAIGPVSSPDALSALGTAWQALPDCSAVMFVSANAVQHFMAARPVESLWPLPAGSSPRAWAPGPGTAEALLASGWPALSVDQPVPDAPQFDSEALWAAVRAQVRAEDLVLVVRGANAQGRSAGRDWLTQQLTAKGARVHTVAAYQRAAPVLGPEQMAAFAQASGDGSVWLFSSSEAVGHWRALADASSALALPGGCAPVVLPAVPHDARVPRRAVATHPRIADAARAAGFEVVQVSRPDLASVVASIKSIA